MSQKQMNDWTKVSEGAEVKLITDKGETVKQIRNGIYCDTFKVTLIRRVDRITRSGKG